MSARSHPSELTDKIEAFRARFVEHRHTGVQANPDGVEQLIRELEAIYAQARELREELSALRWNHQGRMDRADWLTRETLAQLTDPASNVVRLHPGGTAASKGGAA